MRLLYRFWSRVRLGDGCWEWTGRVDRGGYGEFDIDSKSRRAHRVAYELGIGTIPDGMTVDHRCFNTRCVRPDHLRLLPMVANAKNQRSAHKTHCINGHEFTRENTYLRPSGGGGHGGVRDCRACNRVRTANYLKRKAAAA